MTFTYLPAKIELNNKYKLIIFVSEEEFVPRGVVYWQGQFVKTTGS